MNCLMLDILLLKRLSPYRVFGIMNRKQLVILRSVNSDNFMRKDINLIFKNSNGVRFAPRRLLRVSLYRYRKYKLYCTIKRIMPISFRLFYVFSYSQRC